MSLVDEVSMTFREAMRILMLSPLYFQLEPAERYKLIKEYCDSFTAIDSADVLGKKE